jgi:hypothetical protein
MRRAGHEAQGVDRGIPVRYGGLAALDVAIRMPSATLLLLATLALL